MTFKEWFNNLNTEDKKTFVYIREQAKRLGKFYNVKLSDDNLWHIYYFEDEHLTDSHQVCDVIELIIKIIKERGDKK